jgi:hypothetical protein
MPDGSPQKGPDYDDDFFAWTQHQAAVLRDMAVSDNRFDRENVAEEIEDLGRSYRDAVRSQVRRIIEHFLKLQYSPAQAPRLGWMGTIADARAEISDRLSATLRRDAANRLRALYATARYQAELGLRQHNEASAADALPIECPYSLDQILEDHWYPDPMETP